jgi:hypothetical protein
LKRRKTLTFDEYCNENLIGDGEKERFLEFVCDEQSLGVDDIETPNNATKEEFNRFYNSFVEDDEFDDEEDDF